MADHTVTLTYTANADGSAVVADPFSIAVSPGQTIAFQLGPKSLTGKMRITFRERHFFSAPNPHFHQDGVFHDGDGVISVTAQPSGPTFYHCELLNPQGHVIAHSNEPAGGEVLPGSVA